MEWIEWLLSGNFDKFLLENNLFFPLHVSREASRYDRARALSPHQRPLSLGVF